MMKKVNNKLDKYQIVLKDFLYYNQEEIENAGFEELGRQKMAKETAKKMLEENIALDVIERCTGLPQAQIEKLKEKE